MHLLKKDYNNQVATYKNTLDDIKTAYKEKLSIEGKINDLQESINEYTK
jgi:hypothetical protein